MKTVCIRPVPFCYGPTAIAIAVARSLSTRANIRLVAIGAPPSLDLLQAENNLFDAVVRGDDAHECVQSAMVQSAHLVISVCDFDFAEACGKEAPGSGLVFVDPLLWMWTKTPKVIGFCDLYCALEFPGVRRSAHNMDQCSFRIVPQVAEWRGKRKPKADGALRILVNLGGMQSPLGSNISLATAMCEELAYAAAACKGCYVQVCTGRGIAQTLGFAATNWPSIEVASLDKDAFDKALAECDCLLTVPGMSIVFEACLASVPTFFLLPLNYSQHLQVAQYRKMFASLRGVFFDDLAKYEGLKAGMPETRGVAAAADLGARFANDLHARKRFRAALSNYISVINDAAPLSLDSSQRLDGAEVIVHEIKACGLI